TGPQSSTPILLGKHQSIRQDRRACGEQAVRGRAFLFLVPADGARPPMPTTVALHRGSCISFVAVVRSARLLDVASVLGQRSPSWFRPLPRAHARVVVHRYVPRCSSGRSASHGSPSRGSPAGSGPAGTLTGGVSARSGSTRPRTSNQVRE